MKKRKLRGQLASYDVLVAILIFLMMFIVLRQIAINNITSTTNELTYNEMKGYSQQAFDSLLKTKGVPLNWTSANVELIGLSQKPYFIERDKLLELSLVDYNLAKQKLALNKYDFFLEIDSSNDLIDFNYGVEPNTSSEVISLDRIVFYEGDEANATIKVFK